MNEYWKKFEKTGKVNDYLKYKEEFAKEFKPEDKNGKKGSNSPKKS